MGDSYRKGGTVMNKKTDPVPNTPGLVEMVAIYAEALRNLKDIVYSVDATDAAKERAANKIIQVQRITKDLKKSNAAWVEKYIPEAYKRGMHVDDEMLKQVAGSKYNEKFTTPHQEAVKVSVESAVVDYNKIASGLESVYTDYIRRVQVSAKRTAIARTIAGGIVEGRSRRTVSQQIIEDLRDRIAKNTITVGQATLNARTYADLLARTLTRAAVTEGTINRLIEYDVDLVIFSNTGAIDWCRIYENQIFSISGKSRRYPMLTMRPPLHINCTHTLSGFVEDLAEPYEIEGGQEFKREDLNLTAKQLNKKYPVVKDAA